MLLDVVTGREPRTFQGEPYEEIAVGGGLFLYAGLVFANLFEYSAWLVTFFIGLTLVGVFTVRMLVSRRGWRSFRLGARVGAS
jgi:NitT/TauT family transport system substrate-binding protein